MKILHAAALIPVVFALATSVQAMSVEIPIKGGMYGPYQIGEQDSMAFEYGHPNSSSSTKKTITCITLFNFLSRDNDPYEIDFKVGSKVKHYGPFRKQNVFDFDLDEKSSGDVTLIFSNTTKNKHNANKLDVDDVYVTCIFPDGRKV